VVQNVFARLVSIGLFLALLLTLIGEELFVVVFGEAWATAGLYTAIMSIYMFFNFIASPLSQLISVLEKQEIGLVVNIALLFSRVLALWIGGMSGNDISAIVLFSVSGVIVYGAFSLWIARASGISMRDYWAALARTALLSAAFLIPAWVVARVLGLGGMAGLVPYSVVAAAYFIWLIHRDHRLRSLIPIGRRVTRE
jgi:O-antigen/teichoic acid export membrane protein